MHLVCNDEANLQRKVGFFPGRSLKTNWLDGLRCVLEQPKQHDGRDGEGMVVERGAKDQWQRRCTNIRIKQ